MQNYCGNPTLYKAHICRGMSRMGKNEKMKRWTVIRINDPLLDPPTSLATGISRCHWCETALVRGRCMHEVKAKEMGAVNQPGHHGRIQYLWNPLEKTYGRSWSINNNTSRWAPGREFLFCYLHIGVISGLINNQTKKRMWIREIDTYILHTCLCDNIVWPVPNDWLIGQSTQALRSMQLRCSATPDAGLCVRLHSISQGTLKRSPTLRFITGSQDWPSWYCAWVLCFCVTGKRKRNPRLNKMSSIKVLCTWSKSRLLLRSFPQWEMSCRLRGGVDLLSVRLHFREPVSWEWNKRRSRP